MIGQDWIEKDWIGLERIGLERITVIIMTDTVQVWLSVHVLNDDTNLVRVMKIKVLVVTIILT